MNINVTVDSIDLAAIVGGKTYDEDGDYAERTLGDLVGGQIVRELMKTDGWNTAKKLVAEIRGEVIREKISAEIAEALSAPMRRTNTYGEPIGEETTLRAEIARIARDELLKPADRGHYSNSKETTVEAFIRAEISKVLAKELKDAFAEEKEKVVAAVHSTAARLLADAVREGLRK